MMSIGGYAMWNCPKCGEEIEDQFDSCWRCAREDSMQDTEKAGKEPSTAASTGRKSFWIGTAVGAAIVFAFDFAGNPLGLSLGPLIAAAIAGGALRGGGAGFLCNFVWGATFLFRTPCLHGIAGVFGAGEAAAAGIGAALIFGFGFGIWPGFILGLVGGLLGKLARKILPSSSKA
jgi:hypothetical protein